MIILSFMMEFIDIPPELYGIILNFMENPLILSLVNKELYNLFHNSVYGKCHYKEFRLKDSTKLKNKIYPYVTILNISYSNINDDVLKRFPNLHTLSCRDCQKITDKSIIELKQ